MTFYTEIFNGRDENADNPPNQWDSLKNIPFAPDLRDSSEQIDAGIPTQEAYNRSHAWNDYMPDLRDPEYQVDAGIPSDMEAARSKQIIRERQEEQEMQKNSDEALSNKLNTIETNYVENRTDLPGRKPAKQSEPISKASANERILTSDSAKDLESNLDVLQNDPYAIEELFYQGFGIANKARATKYGEYSPKDLSETETKQLKNFISFFASIVERGIRVPSEFRDGVTLSDKGDSYPPTSEHIVSLGVAIDEIASMVEEKGTGETNIDNPINELSGAKGKEKIGVRELADLAVKAQSTNHKLSADTINFPA